VGAIEKLLPVFRSALIGAAIALASPVVGWAADAVDSTTKDTPPPPLPAPPTAAREVDKAATFQRYAKAFELDNQSPELRSSASVCQAFLRDLTNLNGVEFVEPILRATRFTDPDLADLRNKCDRSSLTLSLMAMKSVAVLTPPDPRDILRDKSGIPTGVAYYSSVNFRVYDISLFNTKISPIQFIYYLMYSERPCRLFSPSECQSLARYEIITKAPNSSGECHRYTVAQFEEPFRYENGHEVKVGENAVIKYKGRYLFIGAYIPTNIYAIGNLTLTSAFPVATQKYDPPRIDHNRIDCSYKLKSIVVP
jgi:hypothetical protein